MTENYLKYFKKGLSVVSIIPVFFFFFSFSSYAAETQDTGLLPEMQDILSEAKSLNESGDTTGAKKVILKFLKARLEMIPDDMNPKDYMSMYTEDLNEITAVNKEILDQLGGLDDAVKVYEEAYKTRPDNVILLGYYAGALFKNKQYGESAPLLEKLYNASGHDNPWTLLSAAQAYYLVKKHSEAKRIVDRMMELQGAPHPAWVTSFYQICLANGDIDESNTYLDLYNESATIKLINDTYLSQFKGDDQSCPSDNEETDTAPSNINDVDVPPRPVQTYMPVYPVKAMVERIEGRVVIGFVVTKDGYASEPVVVSADPEGLFEQSALDAVAGYRFLPAKKDGKCVACIVRLPVAFKLGPKPVMPGGM